MVRLVFDNVAHLELDVDDDSSVYVVACIPVTDGMIGSAAPSPSPFAEAGRHSWHVRRGDSDPDCSRCATEGAQRGLEPRLEPPPEGLGLDQIRSGLELDLPPSDSLPPPDAAALLDLDRPDVEVLRNKRWKRLYPDQLALLDRIASDPRTGPTIEAGREWSAAILRDAPRGARLLEVLTRTYQMLAAPTPPLPPSDEEVADAARRRRESVMAGYRELVERGEASDVVRQAFEARTTGTSH